MRLLLDTNVAVWLLIDKREAVTERARRALMDPDSEISLSVVCVWEMAIKRSIGKLQLEDHWPDALRRLHFRSMPITALHAQRVEHLPPLHGDPFDRLLVAQALMEDHALVTADGRLAAYGVDVVW